MRRIAKSRRSRLHSFVVGQAQCPRLLDSLISIGCLLPKTTLMQQNFFLVQSLFLNYFLCFVFTSSFAGVLSKTEMSNHKLRRAHDEVVLVSSRCLPSRFVRVWTFHFVSKQKRPLEKDRNKLRNLWLCEISWRLHSNSHLFVLVVTSADGVKLWEQSSRILIIYFSQRSASYWLRREGGFDEVRWRSQVLTWARGSGIKFRKNGRGS